MLSVHTKHQARLRDAILAFIARKGYSPSQEDLAADLGVSQQAISRMLKRMRSGATIIDVEAHPVPRFEPATVRELTQWGSK